MDNEKLNRELQEKEIKLQQRLERISAIESEIKQKEKIMKDKEKAKKQIPLRLSATLWGELSTWAEDDFRSVNGQIEYLLAECVKNRRKKGQ